MIPTSNTNNLQEPEFRLPEVVLGLRSEEGNGECKEEGEGGEQLHPPVHHVPLPGRRHLPGLGPGDDFRVCHVALFPLDFLRRERRLFPPGDTSARVSSERGRSWPTSRASRVALGLCLERAGSLFGAFRENDSVILVGSCAIS